MLGCPYTMLWKVWPYALKGEAYALHGEISLESQPTRRRFGSGRETWIYKIADQKVVVRSSSADITDEPC